MSIHKFQIVFRIIWSILIIATGFVLVVYFMYDCEIIHDYIALILLILLTCIFTTVLVDITIERDKKLNQEELKEIHYKTYQKLEGYNQTLVVIDFIAIVAFLIILIVMRILK